MGTNYLLVAPAIYFGYSISIKLRFWKPSQEVAQKWGTTKTSMFTKMATVL